MDIPTVLGEICPNKYWGPMANSSCTYEQFAAKWPQENGPVPTKQEMEVVWQRVHRVPKSKQEIETDLKNWCEASPGNLEKLIVASLTNRLESDPGFLERFGIPVRGDKKPS